MDYDVLIIGGGPAGLFAAICAAPTCRRVLVLEKQPEPGRKLLLTGQGQCNFTNIRPIDQFLSAYGSHGRFLKPALYHFSNQDAMAFFARHGVAATVVPENGKVFPRSRRARDILDVLLKACQEQKAEVKTQAAVKKIFPEAHGGFRLETQAGIYSARQVLIAAGGMSFPETGSAGDGYSLAKSLGHTITPLHPGLTPFLMKAFPLTALAGTSFKELLVTLVRRGKKITSLSGDVVITHQGLSGPAIHHLARSAAPGDQVALRLAPLAGSDAGPFLAACEKNGHLKTKTWLKPYGLTQALSEKVLALAQVRPEASVAQLSREKRLTLWRLLTAFPLQIDSLGDFTVAMVTCGGVDLDEVNSKTMESRRVKGLFFAGEVLNIDGDSGGFDLQAAWSTAALAAHNLRPGAD